MLPFPQLPSLSPLPLPFFVMLKVLLLRCLPQVYLAKWQEQLVAAKVLLNTGVDVDDEAAMEQALTFSNPVLLNLQKEAGLMAALRHTNVVRFLGVCSCPPCVVTEYCGRGSLADVLRAARVNPHLAAQLDWVRRLNMVGAICLLRTLTACWLRCERHMVWHMALLGWLPLEGSGIYSIDKERHLQSVKPQRKLNIPQCCLCGRCWIRPRGSFTSTPTTRPSFTE